MTIHTASKRIYKLLTALGLIAALAACGGGGSSNSGPSEPAPDTSPAAFTLTPIVDAAVNTEVSSAQVSITDINQATPISITGGTYSIAGGAFTNVAGTVSNNQNVVVKVTSSTSTNTTVEAVLTVGDKTGSFKVTTALSVTPKDFSFPAATGVVLNSVSTSSAITVDGIDKAVPISVIGGEYAIGSSDDVYGAFTKDAGTVSKGQKVKVRGIASASTTTKTAVELTISNKKATYEITTLADSVAPTAQILFPPVVSMTESNTILVRGTASDDYSTITSIKVSVVGATTSVTATSTDGFKNWQALVPLKDTTTIVTATTENTINVATEDSVGNKSTDAAHVAIRQAPIKSAFPDADNPFDLAYKFVIDKTDNRNRLIGTSGFESSKIMSVDLATGKRSIFKQFEAGAFEGCYGIQLDPVAKRLYIGANNSAYVGQIVALDLSTAEILASSPFYKNLTSDPQFGSPMASIFLEATGSESKIIALNGYDPASIIATDSSLAGFTIISDATHPNNEVPIAEASAIVLDKSRERYLVTDEYDEGVRGQAIIAIDKVTGARSIFSSNLVGGGDLFAPVGSGYIYDLAIDEINQRAIVVEGGYRVGNIKEISRVLAVDLITGNRSILSTTSLTNSENSIAGIARGMILNASEGTALVSGDGGIFAVDLITGKRVVFSKSAY